MERRNGNGVRRSDDVLGSQHHLSFPENDGRDRDTIYKLRLSMRRRLSPQSVESLQSPEGSGELRNLVERLVEIDTESREVLMKVLSMLGKDVKLEEYFRKRIEDPKVSRMWQLVEQVLLACQEESSHNNILDELITCTNDVDNASISDTDPIVDKGINEVRDETRLEKFRVRPLDNGGGGGGGNGGSGVNGLETKVVVHGK